MLASNSTLMQSWFNSEQSERSPYRLYALSNSGSLLGLILYPFLVEPLFSLNTQAVLWASIYGIFVVIAGTLTRHVYKHKKNTQDTSSQFGVFTQFRRPDIKSRFIWLGMAALASSMLLATTSRITQEIAPVPLLWVLPLSIYLLSFIFSFSGDRWYNRQIFLVLLFLTTIGYLWFVVAPSTGYLIQLLIYLVLLFTVSMICHGEVYRRRPKPELLTEFYLFISLGGALGGITINLIIPMIFKGYWEFQFGLGLIWIMMLVIVMSSSSPKNYYVRWGLTALIAISVCLVFISLGIQVYNNNQDALINIRNFYGILSVKEKYHKNPGQHFYVLTHGITTHGFQFQKQEIRRLPTAYYTEGSGMGLGFRYHPSSPDPLKVGMVGLGVGVLAAYGETGDDFRFYEINPAVIEIAEGEYFTFLQDTPASVEIILGDARISLTRELQESGPQNFDMIVLDAFNSDSIPTHLLTLEAFRLYTCHLKPGGILALQISNEFIDLRPVIWRLAESLGYDGMMFYNTSEEIRVKPSLWMLLTNNQEFLNNPEAKELKIKS